MSNKKEDRSDLEIAREIVATHGNNLLCRVAKYFRDDGWKVRISQFYVDPTTDKAREIDLIVEKVFNPDQLGISTSKVNVRLFIECKYILTPVVFWFEKMDSEKALALVLGSTPLKRRAAPTLSNRYIDEHHYFKSGDMVARLWASKDGKGDETDPMYKALNQSLSGYVHLRSSLQGAHLNYPLIICSDFRKFFRTTIEASGEPVTIDDNFRLEVHYAYPGKERNVNEYLQVDVVDFGRLDKFLQLLEGEIVVVGKARWEQKDLEQPSGRRMRSRGIDD